MIQAGRRFAALGAPRPSRANAYDGRGGKARQWRVTRWAAGPLVGALLLACAAPAAPQSAKPAAVAADAPAAAPPSAPASAQPAAPRELDTVRLAHVGSLTAWRVASERGYFREEGIVIDDSVLDTSTRMLPALAQGQLDAATGGIAAGLFNAMAQGIPVRIILDVWTAAPGNQAGGLYVRRELVDDGSLRDLRDLAGRRIGVTSLGHATQLALHRGLQQVGLGIDDVEPVELSYPDMNVAMANQTIDGGITIEPFGTQAIGRGIGARFKPWPELIVNDTVAMMLASQDFVERQTDLARRFSKAYVRGLRDWYEAGTTGRNRPAINEMTMQFTALKDPAVVEQMPLTAVNPDGYVNREAIAAAQDWFFERGYVQRKVDLDQVVDSRFADYAVSQLGPYRP